MIDWSGRVLLQQIYSLSIAGVKSLKFSQRSVWVGSFGCRRLTAERSTPWQFSLPHLFTCKRKTHHHQREEDCVQRSLLKHFLSGHKLQLVIFLDIPEDARVAPDEDTDMDLVADRLVLLSLPVKERTFTDWTTKCKHTMINKLWAVKQVRQNHIKLFQQRPKQWQWDAVSAPNPPLGAVSAHWT